MKEDVVIMFSGAFASTSRNFWQKNDDPLTACTLPSCTTTSPTWSTIPRQINLCVPIFPVVSAWKIRPLCLGWKYNECLAAGDSTPRGNWVLATQMIMAMKKAVWGQRFLWYRRSYVWRTRLYRILISKIQITQKIQMHSARQVMSSELCLIRYPFHHTFSDHRLSGI